MFINALPCLFLDFMRASFLCFRSIFFDIAEVDSTCFIKVEMFKVEVLCYMS